MSYVYHHAALGGTFDRLHNGHKTLIKAAFEKSEHVTIGVTSDSYVATYKHLEIQPYSVRSQELKAYLQSEYTVDRFEIVELSDGVGPAGEDNQLQVLFVTADTLVGAKKINQLRTERGLKPLIIEEVNLVHDQQNIILSSTRIRQGQVDRTGTVFNQLFHQDLLLNQTQRNRLKQPMGSLISHQKIDTTIKNYQPNQIAVVGDTSLNVFLDNRIQFNYGIYDGHTHQKKKVEHNLPDWEEIKTSNRPGYIDHQAADSVRRILDADCGLLYVEGEEDLLTLVCVLLLPLTSLVFYGQPDEGLVMVPVDESTKDLWYRFLKEPDKIAV